METHAFIIGNRNIKLGLKRPPSWLALIGLSGAIQGTRRTVITSQYLTVDHVCWVTDPSGQGRPTSPIVVSLLWGGN